MLEHCLGEYWARTEKLQRQVNDYRIQLTQKDNDIINLHQKYQYEDIQNFIHKPWLIHLQAYIHPHNQETAEGSN